MVSEEQASHYAKSKGFEYFEVSAKKYINVDQMFSQMTDTLLERIEKRELQFTEEPGIKIGELELPSSQPNKKVGKEDNAGCCSV